MSGTTEAIGSLLRIKPVLHVDDAVHLIAIGKTMGRRKSISALVDKMVELQTLDKDDPVFISHGDCLEDAQMVADLVKERLGVPEVYLNPIGPVIGAHAGPGTVALFYVGTER